MLGIMLCRQQKRQPRKKEPQMRQLKRLLKKRRVSYPPMNSSRLHRKSSTKRMTTKRPRRLQKMLEQVQKPQRLPQTWLLVIMGMMMTTLA